MVARKLVIASSLVQFFQIAPDFFSVPDQNFRTMQYNNKWLIDKHNAGEQLSYLYFWGHQPAKDGTLTKSCFSQWWVAPFEENGIVYPTAEHWMMYTKAMLFDAGVIAAQVLATQNPKDVKQLGRQIKGFNATEWDAVKFITVVAGNLHKFSQHNALKQFIKNTGDSVIVEASPVDAIWGIGMAEDDNNITNPEQWKGENLLGYALMTVRDML